MSAPVRRVLPPVWLLLLLLAAWALDRWLPIVRLWPAPWNYLGFVPLSLGAAMSLLSAGTFLRAGTPVVPFQRSTVLVMHGWYRFTRNPMYLGLVLILVGVSTIEGSLGAFLPLPVLVALLHFRFVRGEEDFLEAIFGDDYRAYKARVRRWL
jgi:protein-S-isoprenylcysteine O-methyltransferase Ste14